MKSIASLAAISVLFGASTVSAYGALVYKGCYSSSTGLSLNNTYTYGTQGYCQTQCAPIGSTTLATSQGDQCWCGNELPPTSALVADSFCNAPCAGYGADNCGGPSGYWSVYLSGVATSASTAAADASASTTASSATKAATIAASETVSSSPSVVTVGGQTVVVTANPDATGSSKSSASASAAPSKKGSNTGAIAAGVVVGAVVICAIAGGAYLFMRNRKRRAVEEEYRRNAAVSQFVGGSKPPNSSGGDSGFTDARLDQTTMAQRRMSDGSIADNQDYSRRILKVCHKRLNNYTTIISRQTSSYVI
ncbi:Cell wall integrity and stress response component [Lachnellula suecica]|uniref:Cell wall integrity and stress response component n=1 Tax=Lachnellula suecica TaxID=602035 RepID=A0A8T9BSE5_9HELO|nr:Cell wall integrity and stress response component [Lachnellula suecica]